MTNVTMPMLETYPLEINLDRRQLVAELVSTYAAPSHLV